MKRNFGSVNTYNSLTIFEASSDSLPSVDCSVSVGGAPTKSALLVEQFLKSFPLWWD